MKTTWLNTLLVAGCLAGGSFGAQGQTARIACLSHGGSLATVGAPEELDNFGNPHISPVFKADTIVATSDTTAVAHGLLSSRYSDDTRGKQNIYYGTHYQQYNTTRMPAEVRPKSRAAAVKRLQQLYPDAKLLGFDTAVVVVPAPLLKKEKTKRKRQEGAMLPSTPPASPQHPGVWLALAVIIGLGAAGLLLGDKPRPVLRKTA